MVDLDESHVAVLDLESFQCRTHWKAADHSVALLRTQSYGGHSMLGVADSRAGLQVYDVNQSVDDDASEYVCLYRVPAEEIRNFQFVGNYVAVFHRFEANVSFWNMKEQKTILCINIQDQMKELTEEFLDVDDDDDATADDDHVTAVTSVPLNDDDHLLVYATTSGCIFGMSVANRTKLFNIPCPHAAEETSNRGRHAQGVAFLPGGRLVVGYEKCGLTLMDFNQENLPPRPPTRCQKRT